MAKRKGKNLKKSIGLVAASLAATGAFWAGSPLVEATEIREETVNTVETVENEESLVEKFASRESVATRELLETNSERSAAALTATNTASTGAETATSPTENKVISAMLPLDENENVLSSTTGVQVTKVKVFYEDGSSEIRNAEGNYRYQAKNTQNIEQTFQVVEADLQNVQYEDLYTVLNNPYIRFTDQNNLRIELRKRLNREPSTEEFETAKRAFYMDGLDMRESFTEVKNQLPSLFKGVLENSTNVSNDKILNNKEKIMFGLSLLERQYKFKFDGVAAKDLILFYPEIFGQDSDALNNLISIGSLNGNEAELIQSTDTYAKKIAPITQKADLFTFVEYASDRFAQKTANEWLKEESKAYIVESNSAHGNSDLYGNIKETQHLKNHLIPLLTLSEDTVYAISTTNTVHYGLVDTYVDRTKTETLQTFKENLQKTAVHEQKFLDFWYRVSERSETLKTQATITVVDTLQKYSENPQATAQTLWSAPRGSEALAGVRQFMTPLQLYTAYFRADGQANGSTRVHNFLAKSLTDRGMSVYTHELTHILDQNVWLNGHRRRAEKGPEVFARGLFESANNSSSGYLPNFNLNTAYSLGENRSQNQSPERFTTEEDLKTYMQGMMDILYTLDYAEALAILEKTAEERAVLLNKVSYVPDATLANKTNDRFEHISVTEAASLQNINDLIEKSLVSARLTYKGNLTTGDTSQNDYMVVPLFEPVYAALQNNQGATGDFIFKRNAYDLLAEYGYANGMVPYLSNAYANDAEALQNILAAQYQGNLVEFKKEMFRRRIEKLQDLKATAGATGFDDILNRMKVAVDQDLATMQANRRANGVTMTRAIPVGLADHATAVRNLKAELFSSYLRSSNDFSESLYTENQTSNTLYVKRGAETSQEGTGAQDNPYHSLAYALSQAKDGDVIKLVENVIYTQQGNASTFTIGKKVKIDGQNNQLTFQGTDLALENDVVFENMTLNMVPDGVVGTKIYASGHELTFNNISTRATTQSTHFPTLIGGGKDGSAHGTHTKINILGGDSNTRFKQIIAGSETEDSDLPVNIQIQSNFATVDQGIFLGGTNGNQNLGRVSLVSNSTNVSLIDGSNTIDHEVVLKEHTFNRLSLRDVMHLTLSEGARLNLSDALILPGHLTVNENSVLWLNAPQLQVGNLRGTGEIQISSASALHIDHKIEDAIHIKIPIFEHQLAANNNKDYVVVNESVHPQARVELQTTSPDYHLNKLNIDNKTYYRLQEMRLSTTRDEEIPYVTRYFADPNQEVGYVHESGGVVGTRRYTTTYVVNERGESVPQEDNGVEIVAPQDKIITKGTKTKVERINEVEKTTIYQADPQSEAVAGTQTEERAGSNGYTTRTTTYTMDAQGNITPNVQDLVTEKVDRVVKVSVKPKVEVRSLPRTVRYQGDEQKAHGTENEVVEEGADGSETSTTTYTMGQDGTVRENPVQVQTVAAREKVIKVGTKPETRVVEEALTAEDVERILDASLPEGTVQETPGVAGERTFTDTYQVDASTGAVSKTTDTVGVVTREKVKKQMRIGTGANTVTPRTTVYRADDTKEYGVVEETDAGEDRVVDVQGNVIAEGRPRIITKGTKTKVERINEVEKATIYQADPQSEAVAGTQTEERAGSNGYTTRTTTYTMDAQGNITPSVQDLVTEKVDRVVKVSVKPKVEIVNEVEKATVYQADAQSEAVAGTQTEERAGSNGYTTRTTTYTMDVQGNITPSVQDLVTEKVDRVVKVSVKPKVEVRSLPRTVRYQGDEQKAHGTENEVVEEGADGSETSTTTYTLGQDGTVRENPVQVQTVAAREKVIKVGTKPETRVVEEALTAEDVERILDASLPEGTVQETPGVAGERTFTDTYQVDASTGAVSKTTDTVGVVTKEKVKKQMRIGTGANTVTPRTTEYRADDTKEYGVVEETDAGEDRVVDVQGNVIAEGRPRIITKGTKTKVERINEVEKATIYQADPQSEAVAGTQTEERAGSNGYTTRTTTYTMDAQGNITPSVQDLVTEKVDRVVKVSVKPKVQSEVIPHQKYTGSINAAQGERIVKGKDGILLLKTEYALNAQTGEVVPTESRVETEAIDEYVTAIPRVAPTKEKLPEAKLPTDSQPSSVTATSKEIEIPSQAMEHSLSLEKDIVPNTSAKTKTNIFATSLALCLAVFGLKKSKKDEQP